VAETDQVSLVRELMSRRGQLTPEQGVIVDELAKRFMSTGELRPGATRPPLAPGLSGPPAPSVGPGPKGAMANGMNIPGLRAGGGIAAVPFITGPQEIAAGVTNLQKEGQRVHGARQVVEGSLTTASTLLPAAAVTAPIPTLIALGAGTVSGEAAGAGARLLGASEDVAALTGDAAALLAGGKVAKSKPTVKIGQLAERVIPSVVPKDANVAMTKAVKPLSRNLEFTRALDRALPEVKAAEADLGRSIAGVDDMIEAVKLAKQRVWEQREQFTGPARAMNSQVDLTPVADAMIKAIPEKLKLEDPAAAARLIETANKYRGKFSIQDAEAFLKTTNAEMDSYYAKYPTARRQAAIANPDTAALDAQAKALRTQIYRTLDAPGQGSGPRELSQRYGSLLNLEEELYRRRNVAARQQPDSLSEQVGKWTAAGHIVKGLITKSPSDVAMGMMESRAATWLKEQQTADNIIRSTMANYTRKPIPVAPPVPVRPAGLLGPGPIITPPPADTSGIRVVSDLYPATHMAQRALPAAKPAKPQPVATAPVVQPPAEAAPVPTPKNPVALEPESDIINSDGTEIPAAPAQIEKPALLEPRRPSHPVWTGKAVTVRVPGENRAFEARYAVRELDDVHASHNPYSFEKNPSYQHVNDRNYSDAKNAERIVRQAKEFDPAYLITDSPDAGNGGPVIDSNGNVMGGNSRTMTLARVYQENPKSASAYRAALIEQAPRFGLDPRKIWDMKRPVLVRELVGEVDPQKAITDLNKTGTAALTPSERALADSRRLSDSTLDFLQGKIEAEGPDGTLAKALEGPSGVQVVNRLVEDGVVTPQERGQFTDERGVLTPESKQRIARLMLGRLFKDSSQFENTPPEIRNKLEHVVAPLARVSSRPKWDLSSVLHQAIDALQKARAHGIKNLGDLTAQGNLLGRKQEYSPQALAVARKLQEGPRKVAEAFQQYAADEILSRPGQPATFFDPPTQQEAFETAFGKTQ